MQHMFRRPISSQVSTPTKSLLWKLSARGNPSMDSLVAIFGAVRQTLGVQIEVRTVKTA